MEPSVLITTGGVGFFLLLIGAIYKFVSWIIGIVEKSVIREKNVDTRQDNIEKSLLSTISNNLELKLLIEKGLSENAKAGKSAKKKIFKEIKAFEDNIKKIDKHAFDLERVSEEQTRFKGEFKEMRSEVKDIHRSISAQTQQIDGILNTVKNIYDKMDKN